MARAAWSVFTVSSRSLRELVEAGPDVDKVLPVWYLGVEDWL